MKDTAGRREEVLLGNAAIGRGLVEAGCVVATAYPGTPSTEVLPAVVRFKQEERLDIHTEWSINEKTALEVAVAAAWSGLRAAAVMKQVGLNVASDPLMSTAYTGVVGGLVVVVADDPGPHSSQTEQDTRLFAQFAKVPVLDPGSPAEAHEMAREAFEISERHRVPVILRATTRVCHGKQNVVMGEAQRLDRPARFKKDPDRWAATPRHRYRLHVELNEKLARIEEEFEDSPLNRSFGPTDRRPLGILGGGGACLAALDLLDEWGLTDQVPVLKIGTPFPLPRRLVASFLERCEQVLVLEEPDTALEIQLDDRRHVLGRRDGTVPSAGELSPDVIHQVLRGVLARTGLAEVSEGGDPELDRLVEELDLPVRRPTLCPGCGHRMAFYTIHHSAKGIYPGDIGCYTLGTNLRAVDTVLDMGAAVSIADGMYKAGVMGGHRLPIVATIGDSTFMHAGIPPLVNAVHTGSRFTLVILDNSVTAMTGHQPTAASDEGADGRAATPISIPKIVEACGVRFLREVDPYDTESMEALIKEAVAYNRAEDGGVAVIISRRPCVLWDPEQIREHPVRVEVAEECDGCLYCTTAFECPALVYLPDEERVEIDRRICVNCGGCIGACYKGLIVPAPEPGGPGAGEAAG